MMNREMFEWPVVPICDAQKMDVNQVDLLNNGLYRKCNTYKGGGGYDQFPHIYMQYYGVLEDLHNQFVVQLQGCPFKCEYCYVTRDGIEGQATRVKTGCMVRDFYDSGCKVFHLMGGAPALYLEHWPELLGALGGAAFHSDFLLLEKVYSVEVLRQIAQYPHALHAVSIKGGTVKEYKKVTRVPFDEDLFKRNADALSDAGIPYYCTFTGMSPESIEAFKERYKDYLNFEHSFAIELHEYEAVKYVRSKNSINKTERCENF